MRIKLREACVYHLEDPERSDPGDGLVWLRAHCNATTGRWELYGRDAHGLPHKIYEVSGCGALIPVVYDLGLEDYCAYAEPVNFTIADLHEVAV